MSKNMSDAKKSFVQASCAERKDRITKLSEFVARISKRNGHLISFSEN